MSQYFWYLGPFLKNIRNLQDPGNLSFSIIFFYFLIIPSKICHHRIMLCYYKHKKFGTQSKPFKRPLTIGPTADRPHFHESVGGVRTCFRSRSIAALRLCRNQQCGPFSSCHAGPDPASKKIRKRLSEEVKSAPQRAHEHRSCG